jgi:hypothetical protein
MLRVWPPTTTMRALVASLVADLLTGSAMPLPF